MKTDRHVEGMAQKSGRPLTGRRAASTKVKQRCERDRHAYVKEKVDKAMPAIVSAHIEKAIAGSVIHTKWLWGVADRVEDKGKEARSLAELLMAELEGYGQQG